MLSFPTLFLRHVLIEARRTTTRSGTKHAHASVSHIIIMVGGGGGGKTEPFPRTKEKEKKGGGLVVGAVFFISGEKGRGGKYLYQMA